MRATVLCGLLCAAAAFGPCAQAQTEAASGSASEAVASSLNRHPHPRIRLPEAAGQTKARYPKVVPRRSAHIGRRP